MLKRPLSLLLYIYILFSASPAFAAFTKAGTLLKKFENELKALSLVTITLATMYVGYKILWNGSTFRDLWLVIVGAIIIAAAPQIAKMLA